MGDVFFKKINYEELFRQPETLIKLANMAGFISTIKKNDFVALKMHFGEKENKSYIPADFLLHFVNTLKKIGVKPFLLETNTLYRGKRMNAVDHINLALSHGFGKLNIPVIIGDGLLGNDYIEVKIDKKHFSTCFLAQTLKDIDYMFVISHFTGHMLAGLGGAIKNLGMGCASRRGKMQQHCEVNPQINGNKCSGCGLCQQNCPIGAIEKKANVCFIIEDKCIGCAQCVSICPQGAVSIVWSEAYELLGEKLAEYAYAVSRERRCAYITFGVYITKECDCMNKEKEGFVDDLGIFLSRDPVSIDKAVIDMLIKVNGYDPLKKNYPKINYLNHLQYAESLGIGSLDYKLIEIK